MFLRFLRATQIFLELHFLLYSLYFGLKTCLKNLLKQPIKDVLNHVYIRGRKILQSPCINFFFPKMK